MILKKSGFKLRDYKFEFAIIGFLVLLFLEATLSYFIIRSIENKILITFNTEKIAVSYNEYFEVLQDYKENKVSSDYATTLLQRKKDVVKASRDSMAGFENEKILLNKDYTIKYLNSIDKILINMDQGIKMINGNNIEQFNDWHSKFENSIKEYNENAFSLIINKHLFIK